MKSRIYHIIICGLVFLSGSFVHALETSDVQKNVHRVLILLGYLDRNEALQFAHPHLNQFANQAQAQLDQILSRLSDVQIESLNVVGGAQIYSLPESQFTILNANVDCPGENPLAENSRFALCQEQVLRTEQIRDFLERQADLGWEFDEIIYLGHARHGQGMALGPFYDPSNNLFPIPSYHFFKIGQLKRVVLAACGSEKYYGNSLRRLGIDFAGTEVPKTDYLYRDLPMVISEIVNVIQANKRSR